MEFALLASKWHSVLLAKSQGRGIVPGSVQVKMLWYKESKGGTFITLHYPLSRSMHGTSSRCSGQVPPVCIAASCKAGDKTRALQASQVWELLPQALPHIFLWV